MAEVTRILERLEAGDALAAEELLPLVYEELRSLAAAKLSHEQNEWTIQPTALVHEAYLKLVGKGPEQPVWESRGHFLCAAAVAMRRILIDRARHRHREVHGGGRQRVAFPLEEAALPEPDERLLALDAALQKFGEIQPEKARLVELRFFAGLTGEQAARVLGISPTTADRHWIYARAWLRRELKN